MVVSQGDYNGNSSSYGPGSLCPGFYGRILRHDVARHVLQQNEMPVLWHQRTYEISNFLLYILEIRNSGFYGRFLKHDLARQILSVPVSLQGCSRPTRILNELTNCCDRSIPYPFGVYAAMCLYVLMWLYICISNGPFMLNLANTESYHII